MYASSQPEDAMSSTWEKIRAQVEDMAMRSVIPAVAKEMRSEFAEEFRSLIPVLVEEVLKRLNHNSSSRPLPRPVNSSISKRLKLLFVGILPDTLITFNNIQDQSASLTVELQDSLGSRVGDGPEASVKIKIFVLHGEFDVEDTDDWTNQDFDKNVARPRMDKGPLLKGMSEIYMSKGAASISNIAFTDNSKCMRNGTFRLGARAVRGLPPGVAIRDAVSKAFRVKERRVMSHRKHRNPSLEDGTHCLRNIGNTLCQKLAEKQIHTVKDFLQLYHTDENGLRNILQVAENKWLELVKNAELCRLTDEHYHYYHDGASGAELLLDCVFNVARVRFEGQVNLIYEELDDSQKEVVDKMRLIAYEKRKELPRTNTPTFPTSMQAKSVALSLSLPLDMQHLDATAVHTATLMPCVNPAANRMSEGQDLCKLTPNQTGQGEEELPPGQILPGPKAGLELSLMPSGPGMPVDQTQNSNSQHQNLSTSQDSDSFEGTEAYKSEQLSLGSVGDTKALPSGKTMTEELISECNVKSKRPRLG